MTFEGATPALQAEEMFRRREPRNSWKLWSCFSSLSQIATPLSDALHDNVVFILGAWLGQGFGSDASSKSPSLHFMSIAGYNGGWDKVEGPPRMDKASFFNVRNQVSQGRHARKRATGY
jgi:hypothetical protein